MKKYFLLGVTFFAIVLVTNAQDVFIQKGEASFYADKFHGRKTASGELFSQSKLTAAHLTLPFGTIVRVTNLINFKTVDVRINDRGPFVEGRIIDLSKAAAEKLQFVENGLVNVKIEVISNTLANVSKPQKTITIEEKIKNEKEKGKEEEKNTMLPIELYEVTSKKIEVSGAGIQIGSFTEAVNILKIINKVKKITNKKVLVSISEINKVKTYKVIVGGFRNWEEAEKAKKTLSTSYPDCFIIKLKEL